eukprot:793706-Pelagomonas_calceolata.AAC.4
MDIKSPGGPGIWALRPLSADDLKSHSKSAEVVQHKGIPKSAQSREHQLQISCRWKSTLTSIEIAQYRAPQNQLRTRSMSSRSGADTRPF